IGPASIAAAEARTGIAAGIADAVRPRVVSADGDPAGRATLHREDQTVVARRPARIDPVHITEILSDSRVLQAEPAPLTEIARRGTRIVGHAVQDAGTAGNEDPGVDVLRGKQMSRLVSKICRRDKPIRADLLLQTEIPLSD